MPQFLWVIVDTIFGKFLLHKNNFVAVTKHKNIPAKK